MAVSVSSVMVAELFRESGMPRPLRNQALATVTKCLCTFCRVNVCVRLTPSLLIDRE